MLTTLKNWWRGYKLVELSNGNWVCFIRRYGGWEAVDTYREPRTWATPKYILTHCLFPSEHQAFCAYIKFKGGTLIDEIKNHQ